MGRVFTFDYQGRTLVIRPIAVDEGRELWVMDGERRLACAARVTIDEAVVDGRQGQDTIRTTAEQIKQRILATGIALERPGNPQ